MNLGFFIILGSQFLSALADNALFIAALALLREFALAPIDFLIRHRHGDWGDLDEDDIKANRAALHYGTRLLSCYELGADRKLWIITEADRSATTLLFPSEY